MNFPLQNSKTFDKDLMVQSPPNISILPNLKPHLHFDVKIAADDELIDTIHFCLLGQCACWLKSKNLIIICCLICFEKYNSYNIGNNDKKTDLKRLYLNNNNKKN